MTFYILVFFFFQIQFFAIVLHQGYNLVVDCEFSKAWNAYVFIYDLSLIVLFSHFYFTTYSKKNEKKSSWRETEIYPRINPAKIANAQIRYFRKRSPELWRNGGQLPSSRGIIMTYAINLHSSNHMVNKLHSAFFYTIFLFFLVNSKSITSSLQG